MSTPDLIDLQLLQTSCGTQLDVKEKKRGWCGHTYEKMDHNEKKCSVQNDIKWTAVALAVISLIVGVVGLLVYINQLSLGLQAVGAMSTTHGLYTMLAGFGVAFITTILLSVAVCLSKAKEKGSEGSKIELNDPFTLDDRKKESCFKNLCKRKT